LNTIISYNNLDQQLFEQLFKKYFVQLTNFAKSYVKDEDIAKELVQDAFINLWQKKEDIDKDKSIKSYLYTTVKNRSLNYIRDNKKYKNEYLDIELEKSNDFSVSDIISSEELQTQITASISNLPNKCRMIFEMSRFEDLKYKEIAEKLNLSIKTIENQIGKALKILRKDLKEYLPFLFLFLFIIGVKLN